MSLHKRVLPVAAREAPWTRKKVHFSKTRDASRASLIIQRFLGGIQVDRSARQWVRGLGLSGKVRDGATTVHQPTDALEGHGAG